MHENAPETELLANRMMSPDQPKSGKLTHLREQAETVLQTGPQVPSDISSEDVHKLVHDLQTHQIELELQNEELRRIQEELVESRDKYSDLYDCAPVGYLTIGEKGLILEANLTVTEMLGVERARLLNQPLSSFIIDDDQDVYFKYRRNLLVSQAGESCDVRMRTARGPSWTSMKGVSVRDVEGIGSQIQLALTCIEERKRVEKERERLFVELEAKNVELDCFAHTISHDLKSPLITIKGYVGALEQDLATGDMESVTDCLQRLSTAADKAANLLDGLLELSRIGRLVGPAEDVVLADLVGETLETLSCVISEAGVQVRVASDLPILHADRMQLGQVLQNLIENAVKHRGVQPEPCVEVGVRQEAEGLVCYVQDNGTGIDPKYQDTVFAPFVKLDHKGQGSGLGLSLVKRIVEVHGGCIWVESEGMGRGSTFCFTIPVEQK
jgi:PAS domain S-box-containing protein